MSKRPKWGALPDVPAGLPAAQRAFMDAVRQALGTLHGQRGDLDRAVTFRDLKDAGMVKQEGASTLKVEKPEFEFDPYFDWESLNFPPVFPSPGEMETPPTVTGFVATASYSKIILTWDDPDWPESASTFNVDQFEIFRSDEETPDPAPPDESLYWGQTRGLVTADDVGTGKTFYYWIRIKGMNGQVGELTGPVSATTAPDVVQLLDLLEGEITQSQLHQTLSERIDLIGSLQSQLAELSGVPEYDAGTAYSEDDIVTYDGGLYRALGTTQGNLPTDTGYWEKIGDYASIGEAVAAHTTYLDSLDSRVDTVDGDLSAEVVKRQTLAAQLRGTYTGTDIGSVSAGSLLHSEATARATSDGALSNRLDQVEASLDVGGQTYEAIVQTQQTAEAKNANYVQSSQPSNAKVNDLWIDTTGGQNLVKRYTGAVWEPVADARIGAFSSQITTLQSLARADTGFTNRLFWGFDTSLEGWQGTNANTQHLNGMLRHTPTGSPPYFHFAFDTLDRFTGADAQVVRIRVRRVSGSGTWRGRLYYATSGHSRNESYYRTTAAPADATKWNVIEWDMSGLADWNANEIRGLYIDLVANATGSSVWEVDWVAVGSGSVTPLSVVMEDVAQTTATLDGQVSAERYIKVDAGGRVTGLGLLATPASTTFQIIADKFIIAPVATGPTAGGAGAPFFHLTGNTDIGGTVVPAGTYMKSAYIHNAAITNAKIKDLSADKINTGTLNAGRIATGSLHADKIQSNTIETKHIKASGISGDRITTNTLNANRIVARTITADRIATRSLTANEIQAGTITANEIAANAVTAAKIQAGAVTADKIAANAVTAAKIQAGAVTADKISVNSLSAISANMGSLVVDSLHIGPNAVTIPDGTAGYLNGALGNTSNQGPTEGVGATVTIYNVEAGRKILVWGYCDFQHVGTFLVKNLSAPEYIYIDYRYSSWSNIAYGNRFWVLVGQGDGYNAPHALTAGVVFSVLTAPYNGTYSFRVRAKGTAISRIMVIQAKR